MALHAEKKYIKNKGVIIWYDYSVLLVHPIC